MKTLILPCLALSLALAVPGIAVGGTPPPAGAEILVGPEGKLAPFQTTNTHADVHLHFEWLLGGRDNRAYVNFPGAGRLLINNSAKADGRLTEQGEAVLVAGAVEGQTPPIVNTTRGMDEWNAVDVLYRPAKWDGTNLVRHAELTVFQNGVLVQDHWGMEGSMNWIFRPTGPKPQPAQRLIQFQPAYNNKVWFRNAWVEDI